MATLYINGKFTAQRRTGVQRYAHEIVLALDALAVAGESVPPCVLLCPPGAQAPSLHRIAVRVSRGPRWLHLWEQFVLPVLARRGQLLNLAGSAPANARQQVCTLHDAAVFDHPAAYSRAFVIWYRWLFKRIADRAAHVLTVSHFSRGRLCAVLGLPQSRIHVVPGGSDHLDRVQASGSVLARLGLVPGQFLLAVASDNPTKNLSGLVAAFSLLSPRRNLSLVLVGGANPRVFSDAGVMDPDPIGVVRAGVLEDGELKALYQSARALVVPSLYEGFGLPAVEAMRNGCPVAVSTEGALPEVCGNAAYALDIHDTVRLSHDLHRLLESEALCAKLRERGLARVGDLQWQDSARALLQALREQESDA